MKTDMSEKQQLHIKYRPTSLSSFYGNESVVNVLKSKLEGDKNKIPHTFLFSGPAGCGKTTLARIIADHLGAPANRIIEMNSADFRGIDAARTIIQGARFSPMSGKSKVYILDEVHQATKDFQNALLKVLEDTPRHSYFMLCTTDPQKLIVAVKNRCSIFSVGLLEHSDMLKMLKRVLKKEKNKSVGSKVVERIVEVSEGSPRQALILLDQVMDVEPKEMMKSVEDYRTFEAQIIDLCRVLIKRRPWREVSKILTGLQKEDPESVRYAVMGYCNAVLLKKGSAQTALVLDLFSEKTFMYTGKGGLTVTCYNSVS